MKKIGENGTGELWTLTSEMEAAVEALKKAFSDRPEEGKNAGLAVLLGHPRSMIYAAAAEFFRLSQRPPSGDISDGVPMALAGRVLTEVAQMIDQIGIQGTTAVLLAAFNQARRPETPQPFHAQQGGNA